MEHHNDLRDRFSDLASTAFTPTHVLGDPKIYTGCAVRGGKDKLKGYPYMDKGELKRDLFIRDLWAQGMNSIHDMNIMNTDATSYQSKTPKKCLETTEEEKNKNDIEACLKQRWNVTPFLSSMNVLIGVEEEATLKPISSCLTTYCKEPYSRT